ncbi:MAG: Ig-like domain-containing protein [Myxococcota bacterium]
MRHGLRWAPRSLAFGALALGTLSSGGCFNPEQSETETETETGTSGASSGSAEGMTTPTPAPTMTTGSTGPEPTSADESEGTPDAPPTVALLVDGQAAPGDVLHARRLQLTAQASDDGAIVRVDFFDGEQLLAEDETAPYETELLLTSLDNGMHTLRAVAVDDAQLEGPSDPVALAVDIEGGATVASETNLFQMGGLIFHPGIGVVHDPMGNVIVVGSLSTANFELTGVGAMSLTADLSSTNWQVSVPTSLVEGQPQYLTTGQPAFDAANNAVLIGGIGTGVDGDADPNASVFRLAADGSGALPFFEFLADPEGFSFPVAGMALDPQGAILLAGPDDEITKLAGADGNTLWQAGVGQAWNLGDLGGHRIRANDEGDVIFDVFTCEGEDDTCTLETRKINGFDGNQLWSQSIDIGDDTFFLHVGGSAPGPDGRVLTLHGPPLLDGGGLHMVLRDDNGAPQQDLVLGGEGNTFSVADLAYDEQGQVVAVGTMLSKGDIDMREPFVMRFDDTGNVQWQRSLSFGMTNDQSMALATDRQGRLVVVGVSDIDPFLTFLGDVWVVQLDL